MTAENETLLKLLMSEGDKEAFAIIFQTYYAKAFSFIKSMLGSSQIAEDLAQDVFVKLWNARERLPEIRSLDKYLFTMCKYAALDYLKSSPGRTISLDDAENGKLVDFSEISDPDVFTDEKRERVRSAVAKMPQKRRSIFVMSRFLGISNENIAKKMGISKKTVENQLSLAAKELKKVI
ncbi:MAG: RNA polymerase sigma-70 factor [Bacteroidales bacterium]|jgi:RNA polymerase sigma-70 factor (ECF subfamily)|nr:RNA polymerase sigma-70 factor [Bacteroidales bacterium]MCI2121908.1 RNA polymerase sigma-70 factor [Bacteroidales bacterium]MCI2146209.1 RNA polymerase sigma-70 factor [Bacteroidales bacterium]